MLRERVANNIYVFTSELYAQVTAGAVITPAGAIVIDTLPYPVETKQILQFITARHNIPVRYVINTHYHADHTYGTCFFPDAHVISHASCRRLLEERGRDALDKARQTSRDMLEVSLVLPDIVFDSDAMQLHLGGTTLEIWHAPGHSADSSMVLVRDERILFAADTMMPLPFFADGSWSDYVHTLEALLPQTFENVVQGHGEVILRGEVQDKLKEDLKYLKVLRSKVESVIENGGGVEDLLGIDIEACGKSRIPLNGLVRQLHQSNMNALFHQLTDGSLV